jgi:poly(A) polymerase
MAPEITRVSAERIREELSRILTEGQAAVGFRMLQESGMLPVILPEVVWSEHLARCLEHIPAKSSVDFAFAVLLHDLSPETAFRIGEDLRFSTAEIQHVVALLKSRPVFPSLRSLRVSAIKRFLRVPRFEDHLDLARICAVSSGGSMDGYDFAVEMRKKWQPAELSPPLLLSGNDLIDIGFAPGPLFKEILTRVEDEQLEGSLKTSQQALDFVKGNYVR